MNSDKNSLKENYFVSYAVRGPTNPQTGNQIDMPVGINSYPRYDTSCTTWNDFYGDSKNMGTCSKKIQNISGSLAGVT